MAIRFEPNKDATDTRDKATLPRPAPPKTGSEEATVAEAELPRGFDPRLVRGA